eukprot:g21244.t1
MCSRHDFTVKVDVHSRLFRPGVAYTYSFTSDGATSPWGTFRLPPKRGEAVDRVAGGLDFWLHLGDFIYEYGQQKYPSPAKTRVPGLEPAHDLVSLADYRLRHAFYRAWMWKAKRWSGGGVEEWPLGEGMEDIRKILDGFLGISPYAWPGGEIEFEISKIRKKVEEHRTKKDKYMLGKEQLTWIEEQVASTSKWLLLGQAQVVQELLPPNFFQAILDQQKKDAKIAQYWKTLLHNLTKLGFVYHDFQAKKNFTTTPEMRNDFLVDLAAGRFGVQINFDGWTGYVAERERLIHLLSSTPASASAVVYGGDSHNAWAGHLKHSDGRAVAVDFDGMAEGIRPFVPPEFEAAAWYAANPDLVWADTSKRGFMLVHLSHQTQHLEYIAVDVATPSRGAKKHSMGHVDGMESGVRWRKETIMHGCQQNARGDACGFHRLGRRWCQAVLAGATSIRAKSRQQALAGAPSRRTQLLVDADQFSIEMIQEAIRLLGGHGQVTTFIFAEPGRRRNAHWAALLPMGKHGKGAPGYGKELTLLATRAMQVLIPQNRYGVIACYEAAGLPVLRLCLPPVAFTRVRATLQVDGQGFVHLDHSEPLDEDQVLEQQQAVLKFLDGGRGRRHQEFLIHNMAKWWFLNSRGHEQFTILAMQELIQTKQQWKECDFSSLAFFLPYSSVKGRLSEEAAKTYSHVEAKAIFLGDGPFMLVDSPELTSEALRKLGYMDDEFNQDLREAMFCFVNSNDNKNHLRKMSLLPVPGDSLQDVERKLHRAFVSHGSQGRWQRKNGGDARNGATRPLRHILQKAQILEAWEVERNPRRRASNFELLIESEDRRRSYSKAEIFEAMKVYAQQNALPAAKTFNALAFRVMRQHLKDPQNWGNASLKEWNWASPHINPADGSLLRAVCLGKEARQRGYGEL